MNLKNGDWIIIESKTRTRKNEFGYYPVGWTGRFIGYRGADCIQAEMLNGWFPCDPEIVRCELVFSLDEVNVRKVD